MKQGEGVACVSIRHQDGNVSAPPAPPIFGFVPSALNAEQAAALVLGHIRSAADGPGIVLTPNIQHIALMRHDAELSRAVRQAAVRLCDGFPVYRYARGRGHDLPARAAGREVVARIMADTDALRRHRLFVLADSPAVAAAVDTWAVQEGLSDRVRAIVAPMGFLANTAAQTAVVSEMRDFGATIALLCVGAPTSELFLYRHCAELPPCWALCIGQSVKIALGLVRMPPAAVARMNLEWAWRILLEPQRMIKRYGPAAAGFLRAVVHDLRHR